jgi:hypothetical protein
MPAHPLANLLSTKSDNVCISLHHLEFPQRSSGISSLSLSFLERRNQLLPGQCGNSIPQGRPALAISWINLLCAQSLGGFLSAFLTTPATVSAETPFFLQYEDFNQSVKFFVPLLALHETQHRQIFSNVTIFASFTICSHDGDVFRQTSGLVKGTPQ